MSRVETTTNFIDNNGTDLGKKLVTKDYLISVYPEIGQQIGIPPELWNWGQGNNGDLGNAQITNRNTPVTTFAGGTNWKQTSNGTNHKAAIKTDGTLWTWGFNGFTFNLGNRLTTNSSTPVTTFAGGTNWKQVSCGGNHTAAIKTDGTLWTWGWQVYGQLANLNVTSDFNISTPITTFAGGNNWKQVSSGIFHTAAIKTDGTLWVWGRNNLTQLGINNTTQRNTPVTTFAGGTNWKQVSAGSEHTAAIKTDGTLWVWGRGLEGQIGNAQITNRSTPVTTFAGGNNWKQLSAGTAHVAAIKTDGTLWTWGRASNGQLGNNQATNRSTPVTTFAGGTNWKQLSAGGLFTAAIKTDGTLWTWGYGTDGQLGTGATTQRITPVTTFAGGNNWKELSCGNNGMVAIQSVDFSPF